MSHVSKACGLYRTTEAHATHPIGAGILVQFHNHSTEGPPIVLLPSENRRNRWQFREAGYLIRDLEFLDSLQSLLPEGLYRLREHFHPDDQRVVNQNALVQLGYNRAADPILFFPSEKTDENAISFPERGMKVGPKVYELLAPLDTRGPFVPKTLH